MKGEILFEKMTGISDAYITEAALVPAVSAEPSKKKGFASLSPAWRKGWSVACICLIAAIVALMGTAALGRIATPAPEGTPPMARFGFTYEMQNSDGTAMPGDSVSMSTTIVNRGLPFVYHGSSAGYHPDAYLVLQGDDSVTIHGDFMEICDVGTFPVAMGATGSGFAEFTIPKDATPGVYDLVLSYKGTVQVYKGVLTVGESEPPVDTTDRYGYSFGYELAGDALTGAPYYMDTWVINEGANFTFEGSSMGFAPTAALIHMETQYRIEGTFDTTTDFVTITVNTGDKGQVIQEFFIPADAPTGAYALQLSYDGVSKSFPGAVIVAEPTVEVPAILYNLTMPLGSDWLYEPIDEAYVDGEEVTVRMRFATDMGTLFLLNGEVITTEVGDSQLGYWEYTFEMPMKDSEIIFRPYDCTTSYCDILEAYYKENHAAMDVFIKDYGTYGDGVRVATIEDARFEYPDMVVEHRIGPAVIRYGYSNFLQVLHNGQFCSLSEAYEAGLLSDADLAALENRQRELYPFLYADNE